MSEYAINIWKIGQGPRTWDHPLVASIAKEYVAAIGRGALDELSWDDVEWLIYVPPAIVPYQWLDLFKEAEDGMIEEEIAMESYAPGYDRPLYPSVYLSFLRWPPWWADIKNLTRSSYTSATMNEKRGVAWTASH